MDAIVSMGGYERAPKQGDFTVCLNCTAVLIFRDEHTIQMASDADLEALDRGMLSELVIAKLAVIRVSRSLPHDKPSTN